MKFNQTVKEGLVDVNLVVTLAHRPKRVLKGLKWSKVGLECTCSRGKHSPSTLDVWFGISSGSKFTLIEVCFKVGLTHLICMIGGKAYLVENISNNSKHKCVSYSYLVGLI